MIGKARRTDAVWRKHGFMRQVDEHRVVGPRRIEEEAQHQHETRQDTRP